MGMFDYVKFEAPCFLCGEPIKHEGSGAYEWQTKSAKDGEDLMRDLEVDEVGENFYAICPHCKAWNEYDVTGGQKPRLMTQDELNEYSRVTPAEIERAEAIVSAKEAAQKH